MGHSIYMLLSTDTYVYINIYVIMHASKLMKMITFLQIKYAPINNDTTNLIFNIYRLYIHCSSTFLSVGGKKSEVLKISGGKYGGRRLLRGIDGKRSGFI